jgi:hypothetical protein
LISRFYRKISDEKETDGKNINNRRLSCRKHRKSRKQKSKTAWNEGWKSSIWKSASG